MRCCVVIVGEKVGKITNGNNLSVCLQLLLLQHRHNKLPSPLSLTHSSLTQVDKLINIQAFLGLLISLSESDIS